MNDPPIPCARHSIVKHTRQEMNNEQCKAKI
jgi:hypothetical protein